MDQNGILLTKAGTGGWKIQSREAALMNRFYEIAGELSANPVHVNTASAATCSAAAPTKTAVPSKEVTVTRTPTTALPDITVSPHASITACPLAHVDTTIAIPAIIAESDMSHVAMMQYRCMINPIQLLEMMQRIWDARQDTIDVILYHVVLGSPTVNTTNTYWNMGCEPTDFFPDMYNEGWDEQSGWYLRWEYGPPPPAELRVERVGDGQHPKGNNEEFMDSKWNDRARENTEEKDIPGKDSDEEDAAPKPRSGELHDDYFDEFDWWTPWTSFEKGENAVAETDRNRKCIVSATTGLKVSLRLTSLVSGFQLMFGSRPRWLHRSRHSEVDGRPARNTR